MRLVYSKVTQTWMFLFGTRIADAQVIRLHKERRYFDSRTEAVKAARRRGLRVDKRGFVQAINPSNMN